VRVFATLHADGRSRHFRGDCRSPKASTQRREMKTLFIGSTRRGFLTLKAMIDAGVPVAGIISLAQDEHETERFESSFRDLALNQGIALREARFLRDAKIATWATAETGAVCAFAVGA